MALTYGLEYKQERARRVFCPREQNSIYQHTVLFTGQLTVLYLWHRKIGERFWGQRVGFRFRFAPS